MQFKKYNRKNYILLIIHHLGALENSIHIIVDKATKQACVIDPAWEADLFIKLTARYGYQISHIWLTHWHPDHTNATDELVRKTKAAVYAGYNELPYLTNIKAAIAPLSDGQTVVIGSTKVQVIFTPGHTAGGVCYLLEYDIITGDTLFIYGAGNSALPGADARALFDSMQRLKTLPDEVFVHSGHDYGNALSTTLSVQKKYNPFLMIDNLEDFVRYRENIHDNTRQYPMSPMTAAELKKLLL